MFMRNLVKTLFLCFLFLVLTACTVYTEKQSQALSRAVYATRDSFEAARIDLADSYSAEAARIVHPPKNRVDVKPVYKKTVDVIGSNSKPVSTVTAKQRVVIIPEKYRNDVVVVVSSEEYQNLLKDKEVMSQLQKDLDSLTLVKQEVDQEIIKQQEYNDKMIKDLNIMQKKLVEKDLAILQRNVVIICLFLTIGGGVYLRIKGIL